MTEHKSLRDAKEHINPDIVYQEMYQEMRRYRDYELTSSQWYTGFLVIILGALIAGKISNPVVLLLIIIISIILTFGGVFSVIYAKDRYANIRKRVTDEFEPSWKKFNPPPKDIKPWMFIVLSQIILCITNVLIAKILLFSHFIFPSGCGAGWFLP